MAIDVNNSRFLLAAAKGGVSFRQTLTLGRLGLFIPPPMLKSLFSEYGVRPAGDPSFFSAEEQTFCEGFFGQLGAREVDSLDFSNYEGATFIHDMNTPVPVAMHDRFDAVVDGGTLEHVFNFPTGITNAMHMVRPGGRLLLDLPANNCSGHGFYQFSPELFFRLFQPEFGFVVERVWIAEDIPFSRFYEVSDPAKVQARVTLVNAIPVHLFVQARKVGTVREFLSFPAQADYTHYWSTNTSPTRQRKLSVPSTLKRFLQRMARRFFPRAYWRFSVRRNGGRALRRSRLENTAFYAPAIDSLSTDVFPTGDAPRGDSTLN